MSEPVKQGKVSSSEREKYMQATVTEDNALSIPEFLQAHIEKLDLVSKWVSKRKLQVNGGRHPSGWIPYELNEHQKAEITKDGGYGVGTINGAFLERGDMILGVKPTEAHVQHAKALKLKQERQSGTLKELEDASGEKVMWEGKEPKRK